MSTTVYLEAIGCQMNVADSERADVRLRAAGFQFADSPETADVVIFNTCSVRERAEHKVFTRIGEVRRERRGNEPVVAVMGCVAQLEGPAIFDASPLVNIVAGTRATDRLPQLIARALAGDHRVIDHEGFDWGGIQLALEKNQKKGRVVAGGSTITQQLAKNLFLSPSRSYWRKAEEAVITVMLEAMLDKERIFELYLNVIEWGSGVFGAEAAAQRYFGTSAAGMSAEQAARLAAMAPNPRFYERHPEAPGLRRKIGIIVARMPSAEVP